MDWQVSFQILIALVTVLCFLYHWRRRKLYILSSQLPGPLAWPIFGNGLSFFCKSEDLLPTIIELTSPYKSPSKLWLGPRLIIVVQDPNQLQVLMQSPKLSAKSFLYTFLEPFMGKGLFTASGQIHKNQRKLLQPLFGPKFLEAYSYLFQKHANKLVQSLESYVDEKAFDILHILHESAFEATMDILVEDKNEHSVDYKVIPEYVRRFYHIFSQRVTTFWLYPNIIFKMTNFYKEQQKMVEIVTTLTKEVKEARIPEIIKRMECDFDIDKNNESRISSILEMMVELYIENPTFLDESQLKDHMLTFVATSQDTQSSAIAFTLMMLGMHQNYQEKVVEELRAVCDNKTVGFNELGKLKLMEMCIKEAMRLFPLGPFLPRDVVEDFKLDKWNLPSGCTVILGVYQVHRNPKLWEKPDKFYPEHFTAEAISKRHPFAFLPFSGGPRRCIAQHYSYVNMKIIISTILRDFHVECPGILGDLELVTDVSIRPKKGYLVKLRRRI